VVLHSLFLVFRTVISVYIASLDGKIVGDLVCCHHDLFASKSKS